MRVMLDSVSTSVSVCVYVCGVGFVCVPSCTCVYMEGAFVWELRLTVLTAV
jgi:hypothetical protein